MSTVIVGGARTPIGKLGGSLRSFSGTDLGGIAISGALDRAGVPPDAVDHVVMGQVLTAGEGQAPARQAAVKAGIPLTTPSVSVDKVCLSGINAIYLGHQMIRSGDAEVVVAGGMESMSSAPYLLPGARAGLRAGDHTVVDSMMHDGLFCALEHCSMGAGTERYAASAGYARAAQDELAARSHERAARAAKDGRFERETVAVEVPQRRGDAIVVATDEGIRPDTTAEGLAGLAPAFTDSGSITAGNASQISDGASAIVLMSAAAAAHHGVEAWAEIVGYGQVAGPDPGLLNQPADAIRAALASTGHAVADIDLFEVNEAFAAVALAAMDDLGVSPDIVNVDGGSIAMGHPIGSTGNRITLHLVHELRRRGGGLGAAALCGGGGQGDAILIAT